MIKISNGNIKMGKIPSISLPVGITCRVDAPCWSKCYARRIENLRPSVRNAYQRNLEILTSKPQTFWREVEATVMLSRFFRFHVSGDIPNEEYLQNMVEVSKRNSHCELLAFTKRYEFVNEFISNGGVLPKNLHLIFSVWKGLECYNPHGLPEAHVKYKDGTSTARTDAKQCNGNCSQCAITSDGCWVLKHGEQVVFDEH